MKLRQEINMKKERIIWIVILVIVSLTTYSVGHNNGGIKARRYAKVMDKKLNIEYFRTRLLKMEKEQISNYVTIEATSDIKDKGGFFTVKYERTITLFLTNSADLATVNETKVLLVFVDRNGTEKERKFTVKKPIAPHRTINWKLTTDELKNVVSYKYKILKVFA